MGRHSSAPPERSEDGPRGARTGPITHLDADRIRALGPVTDPLLLDAVQREMREPRPAPAPRSAAPDAAPSPRQTTAPGPQARVATTDRPAPAAPAPLVQTSPTPRPAAARAVEAEPARSPQPAPAPPVSARRTDDPGTGGLPVMPAALHRSRTGVDPTTGRTPVPRATPTGAVPAKSEGAPALDLRPRRGGSSVGLSAWAVGGGLAGGIGLAVLLSLLAYWR